MAAPKALVAGNWKMNGLTASIQEIHDLKRLIGEQGGNCDVLICPPATLVAGVVAAAAGSPIAVGGQDCHMARSGAHTGDVSAEMLKDLGCGYVIVGHSERRTDHGESDATVRAKATAAQGEGLVAIICVGETEGQRDAGQTLEVVTGQVRASLPDEATAANTVIAYEPVWAIGTGKTPTTADVAEVHAALREVLRERFRDAGEGVRILYGGSVKAENARELMAVPHVNGALVGGASLKAGSFHGIIQAYD